MPITEVFGGDGTDVITVSAPCERVDLEALKATKARRKGANTVISSVLYFFRPLMSFASFSNSLR
jgi:hypothetical protein